MDRLHSWPSKDRRLMSFRRRQATLEAAIDVSKLWLLRERGREALNSGKFPKKTNGVSRFLSVKTCMLCARALICYSVLYLSCKLLVDNFTRICFFSEKVHWIRGAYFTPLRLFYPACRQISVKILNQFAPPSKNHTLIPPYFGFHLFHIAYISFFSQFHLVFILINAHNLLNSFNSFFCSQVSHDHQL